LFTDSAIIIAARLQISKYFLVLPIKHQSN
jgi:hypothetical protein